MINGVDSSSCFACIKCDENTKVVRKTIDDILNCPKPANIDKFELRPFAAEVQYTRKEFCQTDTENGVGYYKTYSVRQLISADGSVLTCGGKIGYSCINIGKYSQEFEGSGIERGDIENAVEETWLYKESSLAQSASYIADTTLIEGDDLSFCGQRGIAAINTECRYSSVSVTAGTVKCKNGDVVRYAQAAEQTGAVSKTSVFAGAGVSSKGLTDKEIFELFTGRMIKDNNDVVLAATTGAYGTARMFEPDGSLSKSFADNDMAMLKACFFDGEIARGSVNSIPSDEKLASFFGNIGKRIDEAYSAGEFGAEEYKRLSEMLDKFSEAAMGRTEYRRAESAYGKWRGSLSPEESKKVMLREKSMTSEKLMAERKAAIDKLIKSTYKIDRGMIMSMMNAVRYGTLSMLQKI